MSFEGIVVQNVRHDKAFTITTELVTVDTNTEKALILFKNPSSSGKSTLITHFKFGTDSSNVRTLVRVYSNPTITTNGTALALTNTHIASGVPSSDMEAYKFPTVSSFGSVLNLDINPSDSPSKGLSRWYWVDPGNNILLTVENSTANASTFGDIYWMEGV